MAIQTNQIQLKISLSEQLNDLLESKAERLGVPVTQFVKYLIIKEVENDAYPIFPASERTEEKAARALKAVKETKVVKDLPQFFEEL